MERMTIETSEKREILDITPKVRNVLGKASKNGICHLFVLHTTAAITIADLDPGTDHDMLEAFQAMMPKLDYRHPHDPGHVTDHILSSLIGNSLTIPVEGGHPVLGQWQRIVLVELDGPRRRDLVISFS